MNERSVGVVFVNHESADKVKPRAKRLEADGFVVVVVDNSGDFPSVRGVETLDPGVNVGFGVGCNIGVAALPPEVEVVCLHNPDVDATPETLRALARRIDSRVVALAPAVELPGGLRRHGFHYPSVVREAFVGRRSVQLELSGNNGPRTSRSSRVRSSRGHRFGSAALLALDRAAFGSIGGFDPLFFLYAEDLDLWHRLRLMGADVAFAPDLVVRHEGGAGSRLSSGSREVLRWLGVECFASRHQRTGWRPYRAVHRGLLRRARADDELTDMVEAGFRRWTGPDELLGAVRRLFEARSLRPAPSR